MSLKIDISHRLGTMDLRAELDAPSGVTALFGRSGAGKTSIINAVAGLLTPDHGRITLNGETLFDRDQGINLPTHKRRIGYVFQEPRLFPHLNLRQNLLYGAKTDKNLSKITDLLGISGLLDRRPSGLSGGEKARVAIGRALLSDPQILLMDEPLASLDQHRKEEILPYLERLRDGGGLPILYVSHAVDEVARLATTLTLVEGGKTIRTGPAEELFADPTLAPSLGLRNAGALLTGVIARHHDDGLTQVTVSGGALLLPEVTGQPGEVLRIRIEAQDVMIATRRPSDISALNILPATVTELHMGQGPGTMVQLSAGSDRILARITRRSAAALGLTPGTQCFAVIKSVSVARGDVGHS